MTGYILSIRQVAVEVTTPSGPEISSSCQRDLHLGSTDGRRHGYHRDLGGAEYPVETAAQRPRLDPGAVTERREDARGCAEIRGQAQSRARRRSAHIQSLMFPRIAPWYQ